MYTKHNTSIHTDTIMKTLTQRQQTVLTFLQQHSRERGFAPSMREIGQAIGLANVSAVRGHLAALEKKGYIARDADKARSIQLLDSPSILSRLKRKLHEVAQTDKGVLHRIVYGVGLATWDRQPFFTGQRVRQMTAKLDKRAVDHGWTFLERKIEPARVAVIVAVWPNHSPELVARRIRSAGDSVARRHMDSCPAGLLWARGYAVTTEPERLDEMVDMLLDRSPGEADATEPGPAEGTVT